MLGIGLGGFASGFEKGIGIGEKLIEGQNKREIASGVTEGRAEYDQAVERGEAKADDADAILRFTMPKIMTPLLRSGDLKTASAASEWLRSDTTRRGTDLFGKGMIAAQAGDVRGALDHFVNAGRIKGYGADYKIGDPEELPGGGFRVSLTNGAGKTFSQDFKTPDDVTRFGATYLNPQAAFESWQGQRDAAVKADREVATDTRKYGARKDIDLKHEQQRHAAGLGTSNQAPADVKTAEWLIQKGVAKTPQDAWDLVRRSRANQETIAAQIMGRAMTPDQGRRNLEEYYKLFPDHRPPGMATPPPRQQQQQQPSFMERWFGGGSSSQPAPAPQPAPAQQRPDMMTPGDGGRPVQATIPQRPQSVPAGSAYSPSRQMWRSPDGKVFDAQGRPVAQ
jgi:hypothetical protein